MLFVKLIIFPFVQEPNSFLLQILVISLWPLNNALFITVGYNRIKHV